MRRAIKAWNLMGGLDFSAVEAVAELVEAPDIEILLAQLIKIREFTNRGR